MSGYQEAGSGLHPCGSSVSQDKLRGCYGPLHVDVVGRGLRVDGEHGSDRGVPENVQVVLL